MSEERGAVDDVPVATATPVDDSKRWKSYEGADSPAKPARPAGEEGANGDPAWAHEPEEGADAAAKDGHAASMTKKPSGSRGHCGVPKDEILKTKPLLGCCCINFVCNCSKVCTGHQECLCCLCDCRCIKPQKCCLGSAQLCCYDSFCSCPANHTIYGIPCLLNVCGCTCCYRSTNLFSCCKTFLELDIYLTKVLADRAEVTVDQSKVVPIDGAAEAEAGADAV